jgi:titin
MKKPIALLHYFYKRSLLIVLLIFGSLIAQAQAPNEPTNLVVTPLNTGGMIQFTAPASDGGSDITNYEYSTDNGDTWITPSPAITTSPLIISSGLTNCTSYQVKIRAVNAEGSGTASSSADLSPIEAGYLLLLPLVL